MSEGKHTPGPWKRNGNLVYALNKRGLNRMDLRVHVHAENRDHMDVLDETVATARIVEASLDLLEALQAMDEAFRVDRTQFTEAQKRAVALMDAAIAKATGERVQPLSADEVA